MSQAPSARLAAAILVTAVTLQLAGCGPKTVIKPDMAAKFLTDHVSQQAGFTPTEVKCPSGVEAKVGAEFDCHFTGPEGPYTAHMRVTQVNGEDVTFGQWRTFRS
jgi:Domain of unknown function (DUF4333)